MKFDVLDARMRVFETTHDQCVPSGVHMVARLDGRGFTRLTIETLNLEAPFDVRFRDAMADTVAHLMDAGLRVLYGFSESDEISLLFASDEMAFGRKERKLNSILAGEASATLSLRLATPAVFDCRISRLPRDEDVIDYFRWRSEDAHRNALGAHCYWRLRAAAARLMHMAVAAKQEMLARAGVNFDQLPAWQKRGFGLYWVEYLKDGFDPSTGQDTQARRRHLDRNFDLPVSENYAAFLRSILAST